MGFLRWVLSLFSILRRAKLHAEARVDIALGGSGSSTFADSSVCTGGIRSIDEAERGVRRLKRNKRRQKRVKDSKEKSTD